jgi:hypothetical protein
MALAAYHLHHRVSADIDIFCPEENLIPVAARKFTEALTRAGVAVQVVRSFGSFWEAVLREGHEEIRFQLAYDTPFLLAPLGKQDGVSVHSLDDLAAGKLLALFSRSEERDFVDVFCLVDGGYYTMKRLVELARSKDPGLDDYYLALAFEHAEQLPDHCPDLRITLLRDIDMEKLKAFFKREAVAILARRLQSGETR